MLLVGSRDAAQQRVAQAQAQAARARDQLSKTSIVSPIDGVVSRLQVRQDEMVVIGIQNQPGTVLMTVSDLSELNADVNADKANWYRSVLSWAANNARLAAIRLLLDSGASATSLNAVHAAAFGGSSCGADETKDYPAALKLLLDAGADILHGRRHGHQLGVC